MSQLYGQTYGPVSGLVFLVIVWAAVVPLVGVVLDNVTHGQPQQITSQHCAVGQPGGPVQPIPASGVPCKETEQDYGWPFVAGKKFKDTQSLNGQFVPSHYYQCVSGCSRYRLSSNTALLAAVSVVGYGTLKLVASLQVDRELRKFQ